MSVKLSSSVQDGIFSDIESSIGTISKESIIPTVALIMEKIKFLVQLNGNEKKHMVIDFVKRLVQVYVVEEEKLELLLLINTVVPFAIDALIDVAKKRINLKKVKQLQSVIHNCCITLPKIKETSEPKEV
jgi:hypothetical protein